MTLQSYWDLNRQNIRKAIDGLSGVAIGYLASQGEWGAALAPVIVLVLNYIWFRIDNRNKVTVKGLEETGLTNAAAVVERAVDAVKAKKG